VLRLRDPSLPTTNRANDLDVEAHGANLVFFLNFNNFLLRRPVNSDEAEAEPQSVG
jgi:hypothetical protein